MFACLAADYQEISKDVLIVRMAGSKVVCFVKVVVMVLWETFCPNS